MNSMPKAWHYYLNQLYYWLGENRMSEELFNKVLTEPIVDIQPNFEISLEEIIYTKNYSLKNFPEVNADVLYKMWAYFIGEIQLDLKKTDIYRYVDIYKDFFRPVFAAFLKFSGYREKQLLFLIMDHNNGENSQHFLIKSVCDELDCYKIEHIFLYQAQLSL